MKRKKKRRGEIRRSSVAHDLRRHGKSKSDVGLAGP